MSAGGGFTSGDPLGPGGLPGVPGDGPETPARPPAESASHYGGGPVPPGAFAPRAPRQRPPAQDELASWGQRAIATIVDAVIVGGVALAIMAAFGLAFFTSEEPALDDSGSFLVEPGGILAWIVGLFIFVLLFAALMLLYAPATMARMNGATPGKAIAGCRVVRADGKPVTFGWAALREVVVKGLLVGIATAITGGIAYFVDVLWPLADGQNRALHDYVVDSRVVKR